MCSYSRFTKFLVAENRSCCVTQCGLAHSFHFPTHSTHLQSWLEYAVKNGSINNLYQNVYCYRAIYKIIIKIVLFCYIAQPQLNALILQRKVQARVCMFLFLAYNKHCSFSYCSLQDQTKEVCLEDGFMMYSLINYIFFYTLQL